MPFTVEIAMIRFEGYCNIEARIYLHLYSSSTVAKFCFKVATMLVLVFVRQDNQSVINEHVYDLCAFI